MDGKSMLEIRDLVKVYKTKGGEDVRAIDGVSLQFGEKGMVFLLGKSGSGKSTLLNLCGGLDTPDEGEIIIKGRSSKDFTQADFDSYRNTFIGFIFQEYNVLDEFSVEDNIALALELQGKNKNREQVLAILRQVEMEAFASRKPNTLSGGQKQRVAIARALVKNPEIIMADEPTGALDSNTGRQVLETLKSLSENKLVIVVSHDREFAETYGDRIIELKDGKVISDVSKTSVLPASAEENVRILGENALSVRDGAALTDADMRRIRAFLSAARGETIIANGEKEVSEFRKAANLRADDARKTFCETKQQPAPLAYGPEDAKFIRSRLPVRHAVRIGASGMKLKPARLFFTVLLSVIAFTLFGLFSTLALYDEKQAAFRTYIDAGVESFSLQKYYRYTTVHYSDGKETGRYENAEEIAFTAEELATFREKYGGDVLGAYALSNDREGLGIRNLYRAGEHAYYYPYIQSFAEFPHGSSWENRLLTDTDCSALADDEVVISSYLFSCLQHFGLYDEEGEVALNDYADVLGRPIRIGTFVMRIAGVYRYDLAQTYDPLKTAEDVKEDDPFVVKLRDELNYGLYRTAFVSDTFYQNVLEPDAPDAYALQGAMAPRAAVGNGSCFAAARSGLNVRSVITNETITRYKPLGAERYSQTVVPAPESASSLRALVMDAEEADETDVFYKLDTAFEDRIFTVSEVLEVLEQIFLWIGVAMAVFSMLLLFNFISVSITNKKKEIGILRAVGARSADVFKIFFSESAIISGICFVLAMIASSVTCFFLNRSFMGMIGASILVFGPVSWVILFGIAAVTSFIATFLPVLSIARRKPVDSIRAL